MPVSRPPSEVAEGGSPSDAGLQTGFPEGCVLAVEAAAAREVRYTVCTCVTRPSQYREMVESFREAGFTASETEFLYVNNSEGNGLDAFAAYNLFLRIARGRYVILCHQDVVLRDSRAQLDRRVADMDKHDPNWALLGNAGGKDFSWLAIRITDPWGEDSRVGGPFPVRVRSLDENFIVARAEANLALSGDLTGFHLYGTDICVVAEILGHNSYVIDFHVWHKGGGTTDDSFYAVRRAMIWKYHRALRTRAIATTCTHIVLSTSWLRSVCGNASDVWPLINYFLRALNRVRKLRTRLPQMRGSKPKGPRP